MSENNLALDFKPQDIRVAVLMGGPSREREISLKSGHAVSSALSRRGYSVIEIDPDSDFESKMLEGPIHAAFVALHGRFGEDGTVQKMLASWAIPYTGSGPEASFLAIRKDLAKTEFIRQSIPTPPWVAGRFPCLNDLESVIRKFQYPLVLKPVDEGSSMGLEMVASEADLPAAYERINRVSKHWMAEKYTPGRELTVGILDDQPLPIVEIVTTRPYYDFDAKYSAGYTQYHVPAVLENSLYQKIQQIGLSAHQALGCRDFSRVDILLDVQGQAWVLEVNTIPGFTERSLLPKAAAAAGISFDDLCEKILSLCLMRRNQHVKA